MVPTRLALEAFMCCTRTRRTQHPSKNEYEEAGLLGGLLGGRLVMKEKKISHRQTFVMCQSNVQPVCRLSSHAKYVRFKSMLEINCKDVI